MQNQKEQLKLEKEIRELKSKLICLEIKLCQLQIKRGEKNKYKLCNLCNKSTLSDYPLKCSCRNCQGNLCKACAFEYVCEYCGINCCDNDCKMFDYNNNGNPELRCLQCCDRG